MVEGGRQSTSPVWRGGTLSVRAQKENGQAILFGVNVRLDTAREVETYKHGGILPLVLRELLKKE